MTATLELPAPAARPRGGGLPARRAVIRWAWRLFRREWRQQALILALIMTAVGATVVGSAVATNTPPPKDSGFGTAHDAATFSGSSAHTTATIAALQRRFGPVEVIENQTQSVPGSINTYKVRSESSHGPFTGPMLALVSGHYPVDGGQIAVTSGVATELHLTVGATSRIGGVTRQVTGIVRNPQSFLDEFALVVPGQVQAPTEVIALFDAPGVARSVIGPNVQTPESVASSNPLNPQTISLAAVVLGMILIALVSTGGFTVLARRRLRAIGMLESTGATDRHVRLVVTANGAVVGVVGAVLGFAFGLLGWLGYRPELQRSVHHDIGTLALTWPVVAAAMVLAVVAATIAASRPARAVTRVPIVQALSGRPAAPRQIRRSAVPGSVLLVLAFVILGLAGSAGGGTGRGGAGDLLVGLVLLVPGLILLSPFLLSLAARLGRRLPFVARLALRDLARYRARSGSALAAISVGVLVSSIVMLAAAARYGNVLDYAGPNLASNQLALHDSSHPEGHRLVHHAASGSVAPVGDAPVETGAPAKLTTGAERIAAGLGARLVALQTPDAQMIGSRLGRSWSGTLYVATPQLLSAFGISPSQVDPAADILTARPGLSGVSGLGFSYATGPKSGPPSGYQQCSAPTGCLPHPVIQELPGLPRGTSAPNTVITENAMHRYHITAVTTDWLLLGSQSFTAAQVSDAEHIAAASQLSVESKNNEPSSTAVIGSATTFGLVIALGVLAMTIGLVRSETASELATLTAAGASSYARRALTAVTAGALGFMGALLGTLGGYVAMLGWLRSNSLNGGVAALANVPVTNLLTVLVGMPVAAAAVGWALAGRDPRQIGQSAFE